MASDNSSGYLTERERTELVKKIGVLLYERSSFWIFCHENPDGDTLGCCLALLAALLSMKKDVHAFVADPLPRMFRRLPGADQVQVVANLPAKLPEVIITADNGEFKRIGESYAKQLTNLGAGPDATVRANNCAIINIDHHVDNQRYGEVNLIDPSVGACGELVFHLFRELNLPLTVESAINIYAAILTDTGRFSYGNTSEQSFRIASELIRLGVNPFDVVNRIYNTRTIEQTHLLSRVLASVHPVPELNYVTCMVTQQMLSETGTVLSDTEGVLDIIKSLGDYDVSFFIKEESDGRIKVSARSNGKFDCNTFAHNFGGGGHPAAAGFKMRVPIEMSQEELERMVRRYYQISGTPISPRPELVQE